MPLLGTTSPHIRECDQTQKWDLCRYNLIKMYSFGSTAGSWFSEASVLRIKGKGDAEENTMKADLNTRCVMMEAETRVPLLLLVDRHHGLPATSTMKQGKSLKGDLSRNCQLVARLPVCTTGRQSMSAVWCYGLISGLSHAVGFYSHDHVTYGRLSAGGLTDRLSHLPLVKQQVVLSHSTECCQHYTSLEAAASLVRTSDESLSGTLMAAFELWEAHPPPIGAWTHTHCWKDHVLFYVSKFTIICYTQTES